MSQDENRIKASNFDMNVDNGLVTVKRKFTFTKANIEFEIAVPLKDGEVTVAEIHQQSVKGVIALLQTLLPEEK
ncbi:hypothetical protein CTR2_R15600 [Comamonas thiooxydans]|uniref:hypothetical protein n=1 Tax=Comamonas thiooxydans TaxID=363952 RepID=UPI000A2E26C8|nr:hypothetical protein [Comamonas thiooxydans]BDR08222.1 hypothetical protein CTR2_R15600 [Comamonas thiooxydans]